jgi:hypothetical protein
VARQVHHQFFEDRRHRAALPLDDGKIWRAATAQLSFAQRGDEPGGGCLVSRNQEMYDSMDYLNNRLRDTDILQEYFIPHGKMPQFVDGLRSIVKGNGANLINVTIRTVRKDDITTLNYAKQDMFAFVLYFNQKFNERENQILQQTTDRPD